MNNNLLVVLKPDTMGVCCPVSDNFPGKVKEVYALAELSRATFYVHYKGIYDLLEEIEEGIFE